MAEQTERKPRQAEEDARLLASWNAWKQVCWVHGVGKPRGSEPAIGTAEDEERLVRLISAAFKRKREPYESNPIFRKAFSETDWAQVFDSALFEYEHADRYTTGHYGEPEKILQKKAWKDHVWRAVAESNDPPCKVIYGKLLGRFGKINDIFKEWLLERFLAHSEKEESRTGQRKEVLKILDSLDKPFPERNGERCTFDGEEFVKTFEGYIDSPSGELPAEGRFPGEESDEVPENWLSDLEKAFSPRLCCLMVAHIHGVKIYNDNEILGALGIGHTIAAQNLRKLGNGGIWEGIDSRCRDWVLHDAAGTRFFSNWIKNRCRAEKAGRLILSRVEATTGFSDRKNED